MAGPLFDQRLGRLILASSSPRRRQLLQDLGVSFEIVPADVDETPNRGESASEVAVDLSLRKARVIVAGRSACTVIGSDTIVVLGEELLGKPADAADARRILSALSNTTHRVITGVALIHADSGEGVADFEVTSIKMRELSSREIEDYIASGECFGKAGAYAIQETGDQFVVEREGAYDNVVGFPTGLFQRLVAELTARLPG